MATTKKRNTSRAAKMREYFTTNPTVTPSEVAKKFKTTYQMAYMAKKSMYKVMSVPEALTMEEPKADPVNHPAHYKVGGMETIDFIEAKGLTYHLGNAVKYISRADHKGNRKQDLEKAKWYLERAIAQA